MIFCGFQRPIGQRRVATPTNEKSSGLDSDRLQKQRGLIRYHPIESIDECRNDSRAHMSPKVASPAMPKLASPEIPSNLVRRAQSHANYRDDTGHNRTPTCTYDYIPEPSEAAMCTYGGSGRIYAIRTIHINRCHQWQFQSQLPSTRLDGVIYVTDAARSSSSGYAMIQL